MRTDDEQRFAYLLREADCLDGAREYDDELALLKSALGARAGPGGLDPDHSAARRSPPRPTGPGADHWGQLRIRIGTVHLLAGRLEDALQAYLDVIASYPRTALAAEAQYRIGYAYETVADDFDRARSSTPRSRIRRRWAASCSRRARASRTSTACRLSRRDRARLAGSKGRGAVPARRALPVPARPPGARARGVPRDRERLSRHAVGRQGASTRRRGC